MTIKATTQHLTLRPGQAHDRAAMLAVMSPHENAFFPGKLRGHRVRIAEIGGAVVGFVGWKEDRILALYVDAAWQCRHLVGPALLTAAEEAIAISGHSLVRVMIDADSLQAYRFYLKADYVPEPTDHDADVGWMTKQLK
jgi:hypothetical protein